jgi:predicted patatin/cPLA2 family phospholipase
LLLLSACAGQARNPPPADVYQDLTLFGDPSLRTWGDEPLALKRVLKNLDGDDHGSAASAPVALLGISGGGSRGAYAAGVLNGWSEAATRPDFDLVTGISTGALIAPFAFLGDEYDETLKMFYTTNSTKDLVRIRFPLISALSGDALADLSPLQRIIEEYISDAFVARLAEESRRGRALIIGTTNLDAGRPVLWNITRIAETGHPEATTLIQSVILASASMPGALSPIYIEVEHADGNRYDEMHVDGGITGQIFLLPSPTSGEEMRGLSETTAYLIRNSQLVPPYAPLKAKALPITTAMVSAMLRNQGHGDLYRVGRLAEDQGIDVQVTWLPDSVANLENGELFDTSFMSALYELGFARALSGEAWTDFDTLLAGDSAAQDGPAGQ